MSRLIVTAVDGVKTLTQHARMYVVQACFADQGKDQASKQTSTLTMTVVDSKEFMALSMPLLIEGVWVFCVGVCETARIKVPRTAGRVKNGMSGAAA